MQQLPVRETLSTSVLNRMFYMFFMQGFHIRLNVAMSFVDPLLDA